MKMFIYNTTKQLHTFAYRLPESAKMIYQDIPPAGMTRVASDLTSEDIQSIEDQHAPYGMVAASDIGKSAKHISLLYSIDKPPTATQVHAAWARNGEILRERGQKLRMDAAVVIGDAMQQETPDIYKHTDIEVTEIKGSDRTVIQDMHVSRRQEQGDGDQPTKRGKGRRAA